MLVVNLDSTKVMKSELLHKLMARRMVKMVRFTYLIMLPGLLSLLKLA